MTDTTQTQPAVLTIADMANLLATSERSIRRYVNEGRLPKPLRLGQQLRWRKIEVMEWIAAGMPLRSEWEPERP